MAKLPNGLISFGKNANCTLALCPVEASILQYRPSIPGNGTIIGLFALAMLIHIIQGLRWKSWDFMICMILGCVDEIIGYIGRIMLNSNPFSFNAFVIQIGKSREQTLTRLLSANKSLLTCSPTDAVCITTAPVFYCSAIYVLLSRT